MLVVSRGCTQASLERLDRSGTGRVRPGDFVAAARQVGVALSVVQEANMMDLLEKMGALTSGEGEEFQWVDVRAGLAAVTLAGEKAGGRSFEEKKVRGATAVLYAACMSREGYEYTEGIIATTVVLLYMTRPF